MVTNGVVLVWLFTMAAGAFMFGTASRFGAPPAAIRNSRLPAPALLSHPTLTGGAFAAWLGFLITEERAWAWVAVGMLAAGICLGAFLFVRTMKPEHVVLAEETDEVVGEPVRVPYDVAEHEIPRPVIYGHGIFAAVTFTLVLLVALGVVS
ncbi:LigA [Nocardioidaceae bacterium Broad-1]|uniref:hypothetical protein n=1 Tax=Nocardioides luteus TaxID=1844 RepID=UPI00020294F1|nr:hypothetical protein [Nocardioides luteus]EGD43133.1 LigA [Nocardioidaceae bacterium Broad-1]MBG6098068.1 hypothetical protein [Nocardioides luteus]